jgi:hypothetical protein
MPSIKNRSSNQVTLLVFKDNHAARSFHISLSWISRLGLLAGILVALTVVSVLFASKAYIALRHNNSSHVENLEHELADLKIAYAALENKKDQAPVISPTSVASPKVAVNTLPLSNSSIEFPLSTLPSATVQHPVPASVPISIDSPNLKWEGKTLRLRFNIHYALDDGGTQQGSIVILARSSRSILAYPPGALNDAPTGSLISPDNGESFSVSRFREVKADFGPVSSTDSIKQVEIFLFNNEDQILVHKILQPEAKKAAPKSPKPAQPESTGDSDE